MLLLLNPLAENAQILHGAFDLALGRLELVLIHQRRRSRQTPAGAIGDGEDHRQIAQQLIGQRRWLGFGLLMGFEKQLGIVQNALPYRERGVTPCGIEFCGLPAREAMRLKRIGHALAILDVGARHRDQVLHRDMSRDVAHADVLLDHLWKQLDQSQSAAHPTGAAIESARQIIQTVAEAIAEFLKPPSFFQRSVALAQAHRTVQHQRFRFAHRPDHRLDPILAQVFQGRDPLIAVDHQIRIRRAGNGDDHNRRLLTGCGQRCHQSTLLVSTLHAQMLISAVQLMKLQLHSASSLRRRTVPQAGSGLARPSGVVCR